MKILLTHRYFWPDTSPYGLILRIIGDELARDGHDIRIFTSKPSYGKDLPEAPKRQQLGGLKVRRIWVFPERPQSPLIRLANVVIYCVALFFYVLFSRADVVTAGTFPPVVAAWSASLAARLTGARFIYHMQDIHPEVSYYSGGRIGRGWPAKVLRWLDNQTLRRADMVVTLSTDMARTLQERRVGQLAIHILNNPPLDPIAADGGEVAVPAQLRKPEGRRRVIFAGNLGRFQNLPLLAEGVATCFERHPDLELMFLGDGTARAALEQKWGGHSQVRFAPFLPYPQARGLIAEADIGLVSLSADIYRVAYPSKIATYQALGLKILALVEPESQMARDLEASGRGAVPTTATPEAIGEALEKLMSPPRPGPVVPQPPIGPETWGRLVGMLQNDRR